MIEKLSINKNENYLLGLKKFNLKALVTTETELKLIARAANIGFKSKSLPIIAVKNPPIEEAIKGSLNTCKTPAAIGMPITL